MNSTEIRAALEAHAEECRVALREMRPRPEMPANLSGAYLSGADLSGADLRGANLSGADLSGAYLSGADLSGAYLRGADLRGANLRGANLSGADLSGANLRGADLRGANLSGANLSGANLSGGVQIANCLHLGPIGSRRSMLTAILASDGSVTMMTGCFRGTLAELEQAVGKTHVGTKHFDDYTAAITLIRQVFAAGGGK